MSIWAATMGLVVVIAAVRQAACETTLHTMMTSSKGYAEDTLDILKIKAHFPELLKTIKEETGHSFGSFDSNFTGRVYTQKYWEVYSSMHMSAVGQIAFPEWRSKEWLILDFLTEFERTVDNRDQVEGELVCHELADRLEARHNLSFARQDWMQSCYDLCAYPLKVYHRNMTYQVVRIGLMVLGGFAAMIICILRSLVVIERMDEDSHRPARRRPNEVRDPVADNDEVYEYRRDEAVGWGVYT